MKVKDAVAQLMEMGPNDEIYMTSFSVEDVMWHRDELTKEQAENVVKRLYDEDHDDVDNSFASRINELADEEIK